MNQPYARVNQPYATLTLALALREMFGVQLYKNNARALLSRILSILNLDWLQHTRSVRGVYELAIINSVVCSSFSSVSQLSNLQKDYEKVQKRHSKQTSNAEKARDDTLIQLQQAEQELITARHQVQVQYKLYVMEKRKKEKKNNLFHWCDDLDILFWESFLFCLFVCFFKNFFLILPKSCKISHFWTKM